MYSAHEHSQLQSLSSTTVAGATSTITAASLPPSPRAYSAFRPRHSNLPTDIILETLTAVLLLCVGVVLASAPLRPIRWAEWAAETERKGRLGGAGAGDKGRVGAPGQSIGNPFAVLEQRAGFLNIRQKRKEFAAWAGSREKA